jgi:hypothetical protein
VEVLNEGTLMIGAEEPDAQAKPSCPALDLLLKLIQRQIPVVLAGAPTKLI